MYAGMCVCVCMYMYVCMFPEKGGSTYLRGGLHKGFTVI